MAKENDEVQHSNSNCSGSNLSSNNNNVKDPLSKTVGVTLTSDVTESTNELADVATTSDKGKVTNAVGGCCGGGDYAGSITKSDQFATAGTTFMRSNLNDLVADLCLNGPMTDNDKDDSFGDYTHNVSAAHSEPASQQKATGFTWEPLSNSANTQHTISSQPHAPPTQNASSFSFKHFLSSGPPITAPSSTVTVTTLDATMSNSSNSNQSNIASSSSRSVASLQTSTGARPKVPQSASLSSTSISSLMSGAGGNLSAAASSTGQQDAGNTTFGTSATKMKRSPRFSSFDSQASLAEYVTVVSDAEVENVSSTTGSGVRSGGGAGVGDGPGCVGTNTGTGFRLYPKTTHFFSSSSRISRGGIGGEIGGGISGTSNTGEHDRHQYVPRSYSNYEMPMAVPERRAAVTNFNREARPTRLALNTNTSKSRVNLPIGDMSSGACGGADVVAPPPVTRPLPSNAGEFPAAVLPDFVQDHYMDPWYMHDMHPHSPTNSPTPDYNDDDIAGASVGGGVNGAGNSGACDVASGNIGAHIGIQGPSPTYGGVGTCGGAKAEATAGNVKMLPDFLSDGPIIHSSQRLADVTVGLPSNSIGSPEDPPISSQLSRLRIENDRLQRELSEARIALTQQTRRANDLEHQLQTRELQQEPQFAEDVLVSSECAEDLGERSKRARATSGTIGVGSHNYVSRLKQQVAQLTSELEILRRENEALRVEGAVGGLNASYCDRSSSFATEASGGGNVDATTGASVGTCARGGVVGRPSRTQQISRDLLRAASNAENNLRQLLAGVDNLRQMAADIDNCDLRVGCDVSPDLFSDFLDDCDEYEDYSDGPTL